MRHQAIYNTHPTAVSINEETGAWDKDGNEVLTMDDRPLYYYVITISDEGIKTLDTDKDTYTHTHAEYMKKLDKTLGWVFRSMEWTDYHKKTNQR